MVTQAEIDEIVDYYGNLLIIQYNNKTKARATMEALVTEMLASGILFDVRDAYDVDTAIGLQLDVIGKYVGVDRFFTTQDLTGYFGFVNYSETEYEYTYGDDLGFSNYNNFETKAGKWLNYSNLISQTIQLTDDQYRIIIKLKIVQNNSDNSHKSIDDSMFAFFGTDVTPYSEGDMEMTYLVPENLTPIITVAIQKEVLPKPMGVMLNTVTDFAGVFLVDGRTEFEESVTFTRSTIGNIIDSTGAVSEKAIDVARFTYG